MATLLPADFDLSQLPPSEQRVCRAFIDGLDESWTVVPKVPVVVDHQDAEIDVILVSPTQGVIAVEVKGGRISVHGGRWYQYERELKKSPAEQVSTAKHLLVRRMRGIGVDLHDLYLRHAIALPDVGSVPVEGLGPDAPRETVFAKADLEFPASAVARLQVERGPVPVERLHRFLQALRPDICLDDTDTDVLRFAARRIDEATRTHLASVRNLDANQRVLVTGGAGTGKTWLAVDWAKRAVARGERTALVCFNKPIGEQLQRALDGTEAMVGTYHDIVVRLLEPFGFRVGANPTQEYWENIPTEALRFHAERVGTPFDTIVVDEGQDIRPHWLASLERLLEPAGPRKVLMVADPNQAIYVKPWPVPEGMTRMELAHNLRNSRSIANVVRRLGGPEPLPGAPGRMPVVHLPAGGHKEVRKRVRDTVMTLTEQHGVPLSQIAVLTTHTAERDALLAGPPEGVALARWEQRSEDAVLCETVHRAKGLERTAVVLVHLTGELNPTVLYIGVSRAVSSLTLVGPPSLADAVGIPAGGSPRA